MKKVYKNIEFTTDQLAISITVLERFINQEKESIQFFYEKLNGAGSTQDVRDWTDTIHASKSRINNLNEIIEQMANNELITKHTL